MPRCRATSAPRGIVTWGLLLAAIALPTGAVAQIAPDTPRLISPHLTAGLGVHWLQAGTLPGDGDGVLVTWSMPGLPDGLRLRGGAGTGAGGTTAGFGGVDVQSALLRGDGDAAFDLDWQGGFGVSVGEYALVTLPVGISGGIAWASGSVWLAPYVTAGLAADLRLGDEAPDEEFEVYPSLDLGMDVALDASRRVVLRAAASLGDRQALSLGLTFGAGRPRG